MYRICIVKNVEVNVWNVILVDLGIVMFYNIFILLFFNILEVMWIIFKMCFRFNEINLKEFILILCIKCGLIVFYKIIIIFLCIVFVV